MRPPNQSWTHRFRAESLNSLGLAACVALCACGAGDAGSTNPAPAIVQQLGGDGARLDLSLDRDVLTTAENAILRLEVESAETDSVEFPDPEDGFGGFAAIGDEPLGDRLSDDGRVVRGREYVLQPFLPGEYEIPSLNVVINGTSQLATDPIAIAVESVLEDTEAAELRDIAEPVDIPVPWWWWVLAGAGLAAILAAAAWWLRRRRAARLAPKVVAPHEAALAALDELLSDGLPEAGQVKPFYLQLSDIVRRYVEERFGLRAPEQTTEEFLAAMAAAPVIGNDHQRLLRGFLEQADMVKFAKFAPGRDEIGATVDAAKNFIRQTAPDELIVPAERRA